MDATEATRTTAKCEAVGKEAASLLQGGPAAAFDVWYRNGPDAEVLESARGGVRSAAYARSSTTVGPVLVKGKGARVTDVDGNEYVDYVAAHGAAILGHADERVVAAISKAASKGCGFGALSELELRLAEVIASRLPAIDTLRFVHTPTEALARAAVLARAYTGRHDVVTFDGFWHGRVGVVSGRWNDTMDASSRVPYNDTQAVEKLFRERGSAVAALIVEPAAASIGLIPPAEGFLKSLRRFCDQSGALLVFDETLTGFRLSAGGAAQSFDVIPDLTLLGPVIGGGMALAAYGGRKEILRQGSAEAGLPRSSPTADSLVAMAAGLATLQAVGDTGFHEALGATAARIEEGVRVAAAAVRIPIECTRVASMLGITVGEVGGTDAGAPSRLDSEFSRQFPIAMLDRGVFLPPYPGSCLFVTAAHEDRDIEQTIEATHDAIRVAHDAAARPRGD